MAKVIVISLRIAALSKVALHRRAKRGVSEILPAMVEAMNIPAEVLKLRLHSRRLPEQLDHARSNELGSEIAQKFVSWRT